ncbi:hypothetical protein NY607_01595 [Lysinibacillus sp. A4]|uniref:hypothetical protein n=1 Tax=Lysinibacillus sp. A4 TaxID=2976269 RepID=UPI002175ABB4|nr:hypothetical protein [Lysinibacillus sp. A4]MCS5499796.1 hypothetical protein [Lysinibacillus sp. A4]
MKTLIIYDEQGYILSKISGQPIPREPVGVPFLWMDIPEDKQIKTTDGIGVDISVTPHRVILEDIPLSEIEQLRMAQSATDSTVLELMETILLGGM